MNSQLARCTIAQRCGSEPVGAHAEDVVSGESLGLASAMEEEELRENRNGFKVDGEGPQ